MESLIIKQEKTNDEAMEVSLGIQSSKHQELTGIESFPAEIGKVESGGDHYLVSETNSVEMAKPSSITVLSRPQVVSSSSTSQVRMVNLTNNSQGSEQSAIGNNQILLCSSGTGKTQPLKTGGSSDTPNMVTKFIIAPKTASSGQQQVLSVGPHGLQPVANASTNSGLIGQPGVATSLGSPTKTYTISQGGVLSPQKLLSGSTLAKLPISPAKNQSGMTMISFAKSPPGKQQYVMLTKSGAATVPTTRPTSYSLSPSKVIIKGQPTVSVANVSQATQPYIVSQAATIPRASSNNLSNVPGNVQPLAVSGSKFQYVRLVTTPTTQSQSAPALRPPNIAPAPQRSLSSASASQAPIKLTMPLSGSQNMQIIQQQPQHKQTANAPQQRVILPATSQVLQGGSIGGSTVRTNTVAGSSTTIGGNSNVGINLQGLQGFALIPAQYLAQPQVQATQPSVQPPVIKQETFHAPPTNNNNTSKPPANNVNGSSTSSEQPGQRPRKPCNCTKSQCLKLYCDCFANGEFCSNCNCNNCFNNLDHEEERQRAIKTCLERNPHAFHPKIGKGRGGNHDRRHNKGCNCKRSGCLKNYCECYEAKILCSNLCKCVGCKNFEESPDRKTLMHLADAAEVRHQQQTAAKTKLSSQIQDLPVRPQPPTTGERLPYTFVTPEVAEATCACLVAQAEEAERTRQQEMMEERMILQEFGRCLMQVIQSATKTKAPSPVP